jgi:hypothetical protein
MGERGGALTDLRLGLSPREVEGILLTLALLVGAHLACVGLTEPAEAAGARRDVTQPYSAGSTLPGRGRPWEAGAACTKARARNGRSACPVPGAPPGWTRPDVNASERASTHHR